MYTPIMRYELWGLHPANLIETFASEGEALDEVRGLLEAGWSAADLSLGRVEGAGGTALAERAMAADSRRPSRTA